MFWKFNLLASSHIDTLLEKEDVTLHELMDEDDILQECKAQNRKLIDFIVKPENMEEMVRLITEEPSDEVEERFRYKYPNTACELLTSNVGQINDALAGSMDLVNQLYSFLEQQHPLNPLLASFFSKVMGLLITRKSEMILDYLKAKEDFMSLLLRHIGTSAIMDLLLRLLTCVESPEVRRAVIEWLNESQIVEKLVECFKTSTDEDVHCNAAQSLSDIVRLGREQLSQIQESVEADPLLTTVELEDTVTELLSNMLDTERNESVIVNGLSVIQTLLEFRKQGPEGSTEHIATLDTERLAQGVSNVLLAITPRLRDFHSLLLEPPKTRFSSMPTSVGSLDPPLGNTRLQTARLFSALILTNSQSVVTELGHLGTLNVLLDLYFQYVWNNFLHTHVSQCINTILYNSPLEIQGKKEHVLLVQLISDCRLIQRILETWEENEQQESRENGRRRGYMGHLTKIANDIVAVLEKGENSELLKEQINELDEETRENWDKFVNGTLAEVNKKNSVEMMRGHTLASSSDDDDTEFRDIPFPQDQAIQQAFSDYQLQQMTSNFIDQFGFNEAEFAEQEEKTDSPFSDKISSIDFEIQTEDQVTSASMFEQACNERIQQFDDNDSDEDIWEEKEITFSQTSQSSPSQTRTGRLEETSGAGSDGEDSTDSEEDLDSPRRIIQQQQQQQHNEKMDVDSNDAWKPSFEEGEPAPVAMDTSPWSTGTNNQEGNQETWADFTNKIPTVASSEDNNWADFSDLSDLRRNQPAGRSSSPIAMDTTDMNSRPSAYLAKSEPVESSVDGPSVPSSSSSNGHHDAQDVMTFDLEESSSNDSVQESQVTSSSDVTSSCVPEDPPPTPRDEKGVTKGPSEPAPEVSGTVSSPSHPAFSGDKEEPSSSSSGQSVTSLNEAQTPASLGDDTVPSSSSSPPTPESSQQPDTQSFLSTAGLIKSPKTTETNGPVDSPPSEGDHLPEKEGDEDCGEKTPENIPETTETINSKVDTSLSPKTGPPAIVQNGPV